MRTTVTLDPDVEALLQQAVKTQGITFKQAVNDSIRRGSELRQPQVYTMTRSLGKARVNLDRALQVDADLDNARFLPESSAQPGSSAQPDATSDLRHSS